MIKAIIVDDEELARERIRRFLKENDQFEIIADCLNGKEAVEAIYNHKPDLVFLDIQMPVMNGFEVLEQLNDELPFIIFVTAYDEYAIKAFEVNALDYLLKPFDRQRFNMSLERARNTIGDSSEKELNRKITSLLNHIDVNDDRQINRFIVKKSGTISFVGLDEVDYLEATGNYIKLVTSNGSNLIRGTMNNIEKKLDKKRFLRIHRSFIVKIDMIKELRPYFNGEYTVVLKNGKSLKSSKKYKKIINDLLLK